jgi:hypothetical protein
LQKHQKVRLISVGFRDYRHSCLHKHLPLGKIDTGFRKVSVLLASVVLYLKQTSKIRRTPFPDGALFPQALSGFLFLHNEIDKLPRSRLAVANFLWAFLYVGDVTLPSEKPLSALIEFGIQNSINTIHRLVAQKKKNINIDCLNEFLKIGQPSKTSAACATGRAFVVTHGFIWQPHTLHYLRLL